MSRKESLIQGFFSLLAPQKLSESRVVVKRIPIPNALPAIVNLPSSKSGRRARPLCVCASNAAVSLKW